MASSNTARNGASSMSLVSYTCKNCQKEITEPFKTTCMCKKTYCPECKERDLQTKAQCQTCTEQFSFFKVVLTVRCQNVTNGCVWVGPPNQMDDHIQNDCQHCPCEYCGVVGPLSSIQGSHTQQCHFRQPSAEVTSEAKEGEPKCQFSAAHMVVPGLVQEKHKQRLRGRTRKKSRTVLVQLSAETKEGEPKHQFHCSHGCSWVGATKQEKQRHDKTCELRVFTCQGCQAVLKRSQRKEHRKMCPFVNYKCIYCGIKGYYADITGTHLSKCTGYYADFTGSHLSKCTGSKSTTKVDPPPTSVTPEGPLTTDGGPKTSQTNNVTPGSMSVCPYTEIGYLTSVELGELEEHKAKCVQDHLDLAMQVVHTLQKSMEHMQQAIEHIQWQVSEKSSSGNLPPSLLALPHTFRLTQYSKRCQDHKPWFSPAFYSSVGGYKMCLRIDSYGDGRDIRTSVFIYIMKGEYNDHLVWPFYGEITIDILNQLEDYNHYTKVISFSKNTPRACGERVVELERSRAGLGFSVFFSHCRLELANIHYLKDDCLFIQVSRVTVNSSNQPWLIPTN